VQRLPYEQVPERAAIALCIGKHDHLNSRTQRVVGPLEA
jgi:hypothetical protein